MKTSEQIKLLRKLLKITQKSLAEKLGVSRTTVLWWEHNKRFPSVPNCYRMMQLAREKGLSHITLSSLRPEPK